MKIIFSRAFKVFIWPIFISGLFTFQSAFSQSEPPFQIGENSRSIISGNQTREYLLYIPTKYNGKTHLPLVLLLHGTGGFPKGVMELTGFSKVADKNSFIIAAPDYQSGADYEFIKDLIREICSKVPIDKKRIYAAGISLGAAMSSRLACDPSTGIAAIGAVAGLQFSWNCAPTRPVSVIAFHGTADSLDRGMENYVSDWVELNGCNKHPMTKKISDNVIQITYSGCKEKAEVVLFRINGGEHTWPDSPIADRLEKMGIRVNKEINATNLIWRFFEGHSLP